MTKLKPALTLLLVTLVTTATFAQNETSSEIEKLRAQLREEKDARVQLESRLRSQGVPSGLRATEPAIGVALDRPIATGVPLNNNGVPFLPQNRAIGLAQRSQPTAVGVPFGFFERSESEVAKLYRELKASKDESEKEALKEDLKAKLEEHYDNYLDRLEAPLKQMEARLEKLREEFAKRKEARDELVKHRLDNLWYQANGMSWPSEGSTNRFPTVWGEDQSGRFPTRGLP